jgi:hypothetical protein
MFYEKQPIVIHDRVIDIELIRKAWFKYNFTNTSEIQSQVPNNTEQWTRNKNKYLLLHAQDNCEVLLAPASQDMVDGVPNPETATLVAIQLSQNQSVVIPFHMYYLVLSKSSTPVNLHAIHVDDIVTKLLP